MPTVRWQQHPFSTEIFPTHYYSSTEVTVEIWGHGLNWSIKIYNWNPKISNKIMKIMGQLYTGTAWNYKATVSDKDLNLRYQQFSANLVCISLHFWPKHTAVPECINQKLIKHNVKCIVPSPISKNFRKVASGAPITNMV